MLKTNDSLLTRRVVKATQRRYILGRDTRSGLVGSKDDCGPHMSAVGELSTGEARVRAGDATRPRL